MDDIDVIQEIDVAQREGGVVYIPLSKEWLKTQITDRPRKVDEPDHVVLRDVLILQDSGDNTVGYVVIQSLDSAMSVKESIGVYSIGFIRSIDIRTALFSTMRQLVEFARSTLDQEKFATIKSLSWYMSQWHPVVEAIPPTMRNFAQIKFESVSYYVRVPDLVKFIQHILPALNRRLEQSLTHNNYTGVVKISNYTPRYPGVELKIEKGVIVGITEFIKKDQLKDDTVAYFPPHSFLQALFGKRSIKELISFMPDVYMDFEIQDVLEVIFPKKKSILSHLM